MAKEELARLRGDTDEARRQLGLAITLLGDVAEQTTIRARIHHAHAYLADDPRESRTHRLAAWQAASEAAAPHLTALVLIGIADLAIRQGNYEQAARLLAASDSIRGVSDRSVPDAARIEKATRHHLGEERFAEVMREGAESSWSELAEDTLAS